ncbi:MAG: hypothetical protein MJZ05_07925 [Fibrobacter sp.]|nr:hypothetical protein [Fibrobacter sp.]
MKKNFLINLVLGTLVVALTFFSACSSENGVEGVEGKDGVSVVDTLYIFTKDTITLSSKDTVVVKEIAVDTLYIYTKDTVTLSSKDTIIKDSQGENSESNQNILKDCSASLYDSDYHKSLVKCGNYNFMVENTNEHPGSKRGADLVDSRDGKIRTYATVVIGTQTWMAENLDYETLGSEYSEDYGRRYTWAAAQEACPAGWHLPDNEDWRVLKAFVSAHNGGVGAGTSLKAKMEWKYNGDDLFGFSAKPNDSGGSCGNINVQQGIVTDFWSASITSGAFATVLSMCDADYADDFYWYSTYKTNHSSVRCLKD